MFEEKAIEGPEGKLIHQCIDTKVYPRGFPCPGNAVANCVLCSMRHKVCKSSGSPL